MEAKREPLEVLRLLRWARALQRLSTAALWMGGVIVLMVAGWLATQPVVFTREGLANSLVFWSLVTAVALAGGAVLGAFSLRRRAFGRIVHLTPAEALGPLIQSVRTGDPVIRYAATCTMVEVLRRAPASELAALDDVSRRDLRRLLQDASFDDLTEVQQSTLETLRVCGDARDAAAARSFAGTHATDPDKVRVRRLAMDVARAIDARLLVMAREGALLRPAEPPIGPDRLLVRLPEMAGRLPRELLVMPAQPAEGWENDGQESQDRVSGAGTCSV